MHAQINWVLGSSGTQVQPQVILDLDDLPDYLSVSYDYGNMESYDLLNWISFKGKSMHGKVIGGD